MTPARFAKIKTVLRCRQTSLTLVTDGVHKTQNLSAILRTADAAGLNKIHVALADTEQYQLHRRTSGGAGRWVDVDIHNSSEQAVMQLRNDGFTICAAHLSDQAVNYRDYDFCQPTAIVMGAEKPGISMAIAAEADHHLIIPMFGMVDVILNEVVQQRIENDLYNHTQLDPEIFNQKLFRWSYPKLADFCDSNNIPYPALDEDGGIIYSDQWTQHVRTINQDK